MFISRTMAPNFLDPKRRRNLSLQNSFINTVVYQKNKGAYITPGGDMMVIWILLVLDNP